MDFELVQLSQLASVQVLWDRSLSTELGGKVNPIFLSFVDIEQWLLVNKFDLVLLKEILSNADWTFFVFDEACQGTLLVSDSIHLVDSVVVGTNDNLSRLVQIWAVKFFGYLSEIKTLVFHFIEVIENCLLSDKLCAAINEQTHSISHMTHLKIKSTPSVYLEMVYGLKVFTEELLEFSYLGIVIVLEWLCEDGIHKRINIAYMFRIRTLQIIKVYDTVWLNYQFINLSVNVCVKNDAVLSMNH